MALFNELYAVGDSISDSGGTGGIHGLSTLAISLAQAAGFTGLPAPVPPPPYFDGKFSNGPVLPEITAELLGATLHDFAFGGATALPSLTFGDLASSVIPPDLQAALAAVPGIQAIFEHEISLTGQLEDLTAALAPPHGPSPDSALVSLIGLNDLLSIEGLYNPNDPNSLGVIAAAVQEAIPE